MTRRNVIVAILDKHFPDAPEDARSGWADDLLIDGGHIRGGDGVFNIPTSASQLRREHVLLRTTVASLREMLAAASPEVRRQWPARQRDALRETLIETAAILAAMDLSAAGRALGRPGRDPRVLSLAYLACDAYHGLTAKRPTVVVRGGKAGGRFIPFLADLFAAFKIEGSPENYARAVLKVWRPMV